MKIDIITAFPKMFVGSFTESIIGRAIKNKIININFINIRSFSNDKHKKIDDRPFGGGCGMVIKIEPVYYAIKSTGVKKKNKKYKNFYTKPLVIYMTPQGKILKHKLILDFSKYKHLVIVCGHYEGIDERIKNYVDEEISIGNYVLTGGEIPAMVLIDSITRILPGVIKSDSIKNDSFFNGLCDYPSYTRPVVFKNHKVPDILLSGNHKNINDWRIKKSYNKTIKHKIDSK
ncbi:MAG: tRNA (guanosine(37)-N1)-methyltransferase TrmD [Endomicrobium sp.]|jgi:tRNA (guanine37-N1)-methyltransferase|nr:tRNA (guanosine(37)-N1)-methyltransferase TrmD [Endomicrobium sp.]